MVVHADLVRKVFNKITVREQVQEKGRG